MSYYKNIMWLMLPTSWLSAEIPNLHVGQTAYVDMRYIGPGQVRYSQKNVDIKIDDIKKRNGMHHGKLAYDNGLSAFSRENAAPVLKIRDEKGTVKYILADKHHDSLANIILAQKIGVAQQTMPVTVIKDFSCMSYPEFWRYAEKNYLVDLIGKDGKSYSKNPPATLQTLLDNPAAFDDPVRFFVTISARKISNGEPIEKSFGANFPLWLKRLKGPGGPQDVANERMIENVIAQKLIDNGFAYNYEDEATHPDDFKKKVEAAYVILTNNKEWVKNKGVRLVPHLGQFNEIKQDLATLAQQDDPLASERESKAGEPCEKTTITAQKQEEECGDRKRIGHCKLEQFTPKL